MHHYLFNVELIFAKLIWHTTVSKDIGKLNLDMHHAQKLNTCTSYNKRKFESLTNLKQKLTRYLKKSNSF